MGKNIKQISCRLTPFKEYEVISKYYGSKTTNRSGIPLINHIDEGLYILDKINASDISKRAYCLHPLVQSDVDLFNNNNLIDGLDSKVVMLVMEYRSVANEYLSSREINTIDDIRLSPLKDVNDMLVADKIQNRKDFDIYHKDTHPNRVTLTKYFNNWFKRLDIDHDMYSDIIKTI